MPRRKTPQDDGAQHLSLNIFQVPYVMFDFLFLRVQQQAQGHYQPTHVFISYTTYSFYLTGAIIVSCTVLKNMQILNTIPWGILLERPSHQDSAIHTVQGRGLCHPGLQTVSIAFFFF